MDELAEILGDELDKRRVLLPEVIRNVGLYPVTIRLSRNITTEVQVAVVDAEAPEGVDAAVEQLLAPPMEEPVAVVTETEVESDVTDPDDVAEPGISDATASDADANSGAASDATEPA